jgi:hypothetical protein
MGRPSLTSPRTSRAVVEVPTTTRKKDGSSLRSIRSSAGWMASPIAKVAKASPMLPPNRMVTAMESGAGAANPSQRG